MVMVVSKLHAWIAPMKLKMFVGVKIVSLPIAQIAVSMNTATVMMTFAATVGVFYLNNICVGSPMPRFHSRGTL
jgi:hypothetical protein